MNRELLELMAELDAGIKRIKIMGENLEAEDLGKLGNQLQRVIEFTAEVAKLIDDCEIVQREVDAKQAIRHLIDSGFSFRNIEIDGMRFDINDENEVIYYHPEDDIRR